MEGIANQISFAKETTYGTAVTPTISIPVKPSDGIRVEQEVVGVEAIKATAPKNKSLFKGLANYVGGFESDLYPKSLAHIFFSALGANSSALVGGETIVYRHTITETTAKQSLTLEQKIGDLTKRFAGFIVSRITISGRVGETISVAFEGMAKSQADATPITATYETSRPFNFNDVNILSIGGTDIKAKVTEFEFEFVNGLEMFHAMGSNQPQDKFVQQSEVTGKLSMVLDTNTKAYLDDLMGANEAEVILKLLGDAIGVASNYEFKLTIPKAAFNTFETKLDFGYNAVDVELVGREDPTDGLIKVEFVNLTATL